MKFLKFRIVFTAIALSLGLQVFAAEGKSAPATLTTTHEYDKADRLIRTIYSNGLSLGWAYDANGNRIRSASSTLILPQNTVWEGKIVNLTIRISEKETDEQAIERLNFTTGKIYEVASPEVGKFLAGHPEYSAIFTAYMESARKSGGPPRLALAVRLVSEKK